MADLTRFDFHAKKFYFSEDVQIMSAEEVGQYLLLLVAAWLGGKDASLPDNKTLLARAARVNEVSTLVLAKFPVVETEHGPRRRNDTLYNEWLEATGRSEKGAVLGRAGGLSRSESKVSAARANGALGGRPASRPMIVGQNITEAETQREPNETEARFSPVQTNSVQPSPSAEEASSCDQESKPMGGDWKALAIRHKRYFGKKASTIFKVKYAEACACYTESVVLECFDAWAPGARAWVQDRGVDQPLHSFFKKLPEEAEDTIDVAAAVKEEDDREESAKRKGDEVQAASIERQTQEIVRLMHSGQQQTGESVEDFMKDAG